MKTTGPALLHYFSFNRYDFLKTYHVPGTILGGENPGVMETQCLLSWRPQGRGHGMREQDGAGC